MARGLKNNVSRCLTCKCRNTNTWILPPGKDKANSDTNTLTTHPPPLPPVQVGLLNKEEHRYIEIQNKHICHQRNTKIFWYKYSGLHNPPLPPVQVSSIRRNGKYRNTKQIQLPPEKYITNSDTIILAPIHHPCYQYKSVSSIRRNTEIQKYMTNTFVTSTDTFATKQTVMLIIWAAPTPPSTSILLSSQKKRNKEKYRKNTVSTTKI